MDQPNDKSVNPGEQGWSINSLCTMICVFLAWVSLEAARMGGVTINWFGPIPREFVAIGIGIAIAKLIAQWRSGKESDSRKTPQEAAKIEGVSASVGPSVPVREGGERYVL